MKDLCFITMVRKNYDFLRLWINHHSKLVQDNGSLVIISHGVDPIIDQISMGCSLIRIPDDSDPPPFEPSRREMFFGMVRAFLPYHKFVVIGDVDELLMVDPKVGLPISQYLQTLKFESNVMSVCNFNVVHDIFLEPSSINLSAPILEQRRHGSIAGGYYCKPMVFCGPVGSSIGANSHRVPGESFQIDRNLICFHLAYFDSELSSRLAQEKYNRFVELEKMSKSPTEIGSWRKGIINHRRIVKRMRLSDAFDWDGEEVRNYFNKLEAIGKKRGFIRPHYEWFRHVTLPDRFTGQI